MKSSYLLLLLCFPCLLNAGEFSSDFKNTHDRVWLGEEYGPIRWRTGSFGMVESFACATERTASVHLLAYGLNSDDPSASFVLSVRMGVEEKTKRGSAGFMVGVIDQETRDPRASLLMGKGMSVGVRTNGKLFIGKEESRGALSSLEDLTLRLEAVPSKKKGFMFFACRLFEGGTGKELSRLSSPMIKSEILAGNMAIGCNIDPQSNAKGGEVVPFLVFRMESKRRDGGSPARSCLRSDPLCLAHLEPANACLTAQMPPLGEKEANSVRLDAKDGSGKWTKQAVAQIDPLSRTATFPSQEMGRFKRRCLSCRF